MPASVVVGGEGYRFHSAVVVIGRHKQQGARVSQRPARCRTDHCSAGIDCVNLHQPRRRPGAVEITAGGIVVPSDPPVVITVHQRGRVEGGRCRVCLCVDSESGVSAVLDLIPRGVVGCRPCQQRAGIIGCAPIIWRLQHGRAGTRADAGFCEICRDGLVAGH